MSKGETSALYAASVQGSAAIVRRLLEGGADPNRLSLGDDEGLPLCAASAWGHTETVEALLVGGADPDQAEEYGWTALLWASANGHAETVAVLLGYGADVNVRDEAGGTRERLREAYRSCGDRRCAGTGWAVSESERSPRIIHVSWGRLEVSGVGSGKDFKLFPGSGRAFLLDLLRGP